MKDCAGNEVEVGDKVAFCKVGTSRLEVGIVGSLSPKGVTIDLGVYTYQGIDYPQTLNRQKDQFALVEKASTIYPS